MQTLIQDATHVLFDEAPARQTMPAVDHYAGNQRFVDKALALRGQLGPVFDITIDLEDGAAVGEATHAAQWAAKTLGQWPYPIDDFAGVGVRILPIQSKGSIEQLDVLLAQPMPSLRYLMIPKLMGLEDAQAALWEIETRCLRNGWERMPQVHVLIETHGALADVNGIAGLRAITSLSFGVMDFVSSHYGAISDEAIRSPLQFEHPLVRRAKIELSAACHRFGKIPSHNVCTEFKQPAQAYLDAKRAKDEFGYLRMWSIHPNQVADILRAFAPSDHELQIALEILDKAQQNAWGPIEHAGRLHDRASFRYYLNVLLGAQRTGHPLAPRE